MQFLHQYYESAAYAAGHLGSVVSIAIPRARALQALVIEIDAAVIGGAPTNSSPESYFSNIRLTAGKDVIVDLDGCEAWKLGSILGTTKAPKINDALTHPRCAIVIPFGPAFALRTALYNEVRLDLTIASNVTRVDGASITTLTYRVAGIEQDFLPPLQDGMPVTRRFLRSQVSTPAAAPYGLDLGLNEQVNGLMMISYDALTTALATLDATNANVADVRLDLDRAGDKPRVISADWRTLCLAGLWQAGVEGHSDVATTSGFWHDWIATGWWQLGEGGVPVDVRNASRFRIEATMAGVVAASQFVVVRDSIVVG